MAVRRRDAGWVQLALGGAGNKVRPVFGRVTKLWWVRCFEFRLSEIGQVVVPNEDSHVDQKPDSIACVYGSHMPGMHETATWKHMNVRLTAIS